MLGVERLILPKYSVGHFARTHIIGYKPNGATGKVTRKVQMSSHFAMYTPPLKALERRQLIVPVGRLLIGMAHFKQQIFSQDVTD